MRCFIALDIPEEISEKICYAQKNFKMDGVKLTERENLHFTLKFIGEIGDEMVDKVKSKLGEINEKSFEIEISGLGAFPNPARPRIIWVGCKSGDMERLAKKIDYRMWEIGLPPEKRYTNHITIARVKGKPGKNLQKILMELKNFSAGSMKVNEIKLKRSVLKPTGPVYSDVASFRLK